MALTDTEHKRLQDLQDEMITLVGGTDTDQAAAAFSKIVRVCRSVLSREASDRKMREDAQKLRASRESREQRKNGNGNNRPTTGVNP